MTTNNPSNENFRLASALQYFIYGPLEINRREVCEFFGAPLGKFDEFYEQAHVLLWGKGNFSSHFDDTCFLAIQMVLGG